MRIARVVRFSAAAILAVACASDSAIGPPKGFDHSAVSFDCGPADGPAIAIYLAPDSIMSPRPTGTFVRIYVPRSLDQVVGRIWPIDGANNESAAWFYSGDATPELASEGYVVVGPLAADSTISGSVTLAFPHAGHVGGGFHAGWIHQTTLCG